MENGIYYSKGGVYFARTSDGRLEEEAQVSIVRNDSGGYSVTLSSTIISPKSFSGWVTKTRAHSNNAHRIVEMMLSEVGNDANPTLHVPETVVALVPASEDYETVVSGWKILGLLFLLIVMLGGFWIGPEINGWLVLLAVSVVVFLYSKLIRYTRRKSRLVR